MRKSKNRYFHHIFVFPGDAPGEITLNVVWMERELDAYKLSRWMFPFNYNCFWHTTTIIFICHNNIKMRTECKMLAGEIFVKKSSIYQAPLAFDAPVRGVPVGISAPPLRWKNYRVVSLPDGGKISKICLFVLTWSTNVTDGRTDSKDRAYASHCAVKTTLTWIYVTTIRHLN